MTCYHPNIQVMQTVMDPDAPFILMTYGYYGYCGACGLKGNIYSNASAARYHFYHSEFVRTLGSMGFKDPEKLIKSEPEVEAIDIYSVANGAYNKIMSYSINPTPYWIIVSDEGHAAIPVRHTSKEAAEKEAQRLTAAKPGVNFTVFEAKYSLKTPKAEPVKTTYERPHEPRTASGHDWGWGSSYIYPYSSRWPY